MSKWRRKSKASELNKLLSTYPVDITTLRRLAISPNGLLSREIRRKAWPHLLDVADLDIKLPNNVRDHEMYRQVVLDVERSGRRFPKDMTQSEILLMQNKLTDLILSIVTKHPELNYYQGYHDISITILFVCGSDLALPILERLSTYHLRDFMDPTMDNTTHILNYLIPILSKGNAELVRFMEKAEVGTVFAISWLITWFGYVLESEEDLERLFDFFIACHPLMPVYLAAQIILDNADMVLACECDMPFVFQALNRCAMQPGLPLEKLISQASDSFIQYPPSSLAEQAKSYYKENMAISTFSDYVLTAYHDNPDDVLRRRGIVPKSKPKTSNKRRQNLAVVPYYDHWRAVKTFAVAASGAVGAVVLAWSPFLLDYL